MGGKITENLGFISPLRKVKIFLSFFLFIFKFSIKHCISLFVFLNFFLNMYLVLQIRYQYKQRFSTCFICYLKVVKIKDIHFCVKNWKMKRKKKKKIDLPERGFEPQIFSNFPTHDLNFHVK